jgi:hypothetical protein
MNGKNRPEITFHGHSLNNGLVNRKNIEQRLKLGCRSVELDVLANSKGDLVIAHDQEDADNGEALYRVLDLFVEQKNSILVLLELKTDDKIVFGKLRDSIITRGLQASTTIYAFPKIAQSFPWSKPRKVPLGIIEPYPWRIPATTTVYQPDHLMIGWVGKNYTQWSSLERWAFKKLWKILHLSARLAGYTNLILATAESHQDFEWAKQQGVFNNVLTEDSVLKELLNLTD